MTSPGSPTRSPRWPARTIVRAGTTVLEHLSNLILISIALLVGYGVLARYITGSSVAYINEFAVLLACWVAFLGAAEGVRIRYHVAIDLFLSRLSARTRVVIDLLVNGVTVVSVGILGFLGVEYALESGARLQTLDISRSFLIASMPAGFLLMAWYSVTHAWNAAKHVRAGEFDEYEVKSSIEVSLETAAQADAASGFDPEARP